MFLSAKGAGGDRRVVGGGRLPDPPPESRSRSYRRSPNPSRWAGPTGTALAAAKRGPSPCGGKDQVTIFRNQVVFDS